MLKCFWALAEFISNSVYLGCCPHHSRLTLFSTLSLKQAFTRSFSLYNRTNLSFSSLPRFFSSSILWPTQLLTQSRGSGRPGFLWLYLALNRCSALERNIPPLLACVCMSFVCDSSFIPVLPSCTSDSDSAAQHWRTGSGLAHLPPHTNHQCKTWHTLFIN